MANHVTIKYYLLSTKVNAGSLPVYMRITYARKKAELHTGFTSIKKEWNETEQITKNNHSINLELSKKKALVYSKLVELNNAGKRVTAAILKDLITGKSQVKTRILSYLASYIDELKIKDQIKQISLNKYYQSETSLKKYISGKYGLEDLNIDEVNYDFINGYDLFLKKTENLHKNTINKYHSRLRTLCLKALAEGIVSKQPYANFKLISQKTERDYLTQNEVNAIAGANLAKNESLEKVRDLFLFSVYTGMRFQDAQNLTVDSLITNKKKKLLKTTQDKTGRFVEIPLLDIPIKIIDKYRDQPERNVLGKLLPKISNQKVNAYLKIIGDLSGTKKSLTHHIARHTFATTICLNNGMPIEDVSKLLGHSSLKTTMIYGRITQQRLQKSMDRINKML